jgi:cytochrome P450
METAPFDMFAPEMCVDPYPEYARLRAVDPVHESDLGYIMLFRHADVARFFADRSLEHQYSLTQQLRGGPEALDQPYYDLFRRMVFVLDNPDHRRVRLLFANSFTPAQTRGLADRMRTVAAGLVDAVEPDGGMDFVRDFAEPFPIRVIGDLLGVPVADQLWIGRLAQRLNPVLQFLPMTDTEQEQANQAVVELASAFRALAEDKRRHPADDLLTRMVAALDEHERLDMQELVANAILLYLAGFETSSGSTGLSLLSLHRQPDQLDLLRQDRSLIRAAVEELLRFDAPGQATARVTTEPVKFGAVEVDTGYGVVAWIGAANRDPDAYPAPDRLDLRRQQTDLLTFGGGAHFCIGHALARQELAITLDVILDRLPSHRLATLDPPFRPTSLMRGLTSLPVTW